MKKILILIFTITLFAINYSSAQTPNLDVICEDLPFLISNTDPNQDCPLIICINQSVINCPEPNECELQNNVGYRTCSTIEHHTTSPFSQICYYQQLEFCQSIGCEIKTQSITISRGVLGETITLTGSTADAFINIVFNGAGGNITLGSFSYDCEGNECDKAYLNIQNLGSGPRITLL